MSETYMKLIHAIFPEFSVVGGGTSAVPEDELPEYAWSMVGMTHFVNALHAVYDIWP